MITYEHIPRADVVIGRHRWGAGSATVYHRATGTLLGVVRRWPDGAWIVYLPFDDERSVCEDFFTREEAVEALLDPQTHIPGPIGAGTHAGAQLRPATEAEHRAVEPTAWAHWDTVRRLFTCTEE